MTALLVGLDAVAILRESRRASEPEPAAMASLAELSGADGVTLGLRTDRRNGKERDLKLLRAIVKSRFQVRIPPTAESIKIVAPIRPDAVVLVPERADNLAHDAGYDLTMSGATVSEGATALREAGLEVLALVDPDLEQVKAARRLGLSGVSLVGVRLGSARSAETVAKELENLEHCVKLAVKLGLVVQVAHGLDTRAVSLLAGMSGVSAVEVGHALCARAVAVGFPEAVRTFQSALNRPRRA